MQNGLGESSEQVLVDSVLARVLENKNNQKRRPRRKSSK